MNQLHFREALRNFASGVTVVTTADQDRPAGMTVSAFSAVSLDPPLIQICVDRQAFTHEVIARAGQFAVNILAEDQAHLSRLFASHEQHKFASVSYRRSDTGLPLLDGVLTALECRVVEAVIAGDHTIYIGEVLATHSGAGAPLLYYQSAYHQLPALEVVERYAHVDS